MNHQIDFDFSAAREAGNVAGQRCIDKAHSTDPTFAERARAAILAHLREVGQASGEELTDVAIASGARPHDQRAFGPVFGGLARNGLIRTVAFCTRAKGHGTAGGRVWALVH